MPLMVSEQSLSTSVSAGLIINTLKNLTIMSSLISSDVYTKQAEKQQITEVCTVRKYYSWFGCWYIPQALISAAYSLI